jgi:hypothetical protein
MKKQHEKILPNVVLFLLLYHQQLFILILAPNYQSFLSVPNWIWTRLEATTFFTALCQDKTLIQRTTRKAVMVFIFGLTRFQGTQTQPKIIHLLCLSVEPAHNK